MTLNSLPTELFHKVVKQLDTPSLGSLRATARWVKSRCDPYLFERVNNTQDIDLDLNGLKRLRILSTSQDLKRVVHRINLITLYYHLTPAPWDLSLLEPTDFAPLPPGWRFGGPHRFRPDPPFWPSDNPAEPWSPLETTQDREWMNNRIAEQNITDGLAIFEEFVKAFKSLGSLRSVYLEAIVVLGPKPDLRWPIARVQSLPWSTVWVWTTRAFRILLAAIAKSRLRLEELHIYKETDICSIPIDHLNYAFSWSSERDLAEVFRGLKSFSISISTHLLSKSSSVNPSMDSSEHHYDPINILTPYQAEGIDNDMDVPAVSSTFSNLLNLESLNLNFYQIVWRRNGPMAYKNVLANLFCNSLFPRLTCVSIQGFPATSEFFSFLAMKCPRLERMRLEHIYLDYDGWNETLEPFISPFMKFIYLSNLYYPRRGFEDSFLSDSAPTTAAHLTEYSQIKNRTRAGVLSQMNANEMEAESNLAIEIGPLSEALVEGWQTAESHFSLMEKKLKVGPLHRFEYLE